MNATLMIQQFMQFMIDLKIYELEQVFYLKVARNVPFYSRSRRLDLYNGYVMLL
jgi:hypothetical protein